ncbi:hypothetical protein MASR2M70_16430 [Bacillota bacterium]
MIKQFELTLEQAEKSGDRRPAYDWAYALYAELMSELDSSYSGSLHEDGLNPINQHLVLPFRPGNGEIKWKVNLLGEEAIEHFSPILRSREIFRVDKAYTELRVLSRSEGRRISEEELYTRYLETEEAPDKSRLEFSSTTSFKSDGQYVLFPSAELIIKSAVIKWNAYSTQSALEDIEALKQMTDRTTIRSYSLKSGSFLLKGNRLPGFTGYVDLNIKGPEPMKKLVSLLLGFLQYSGVGIKTTLGMGGCRII